MIEKENEKIYSKIHDEHNLIDTIVSIFVCYVCAIIIYFLIMSIKSIYIDKILF